MRDENAAKLLAMVMNWDETTVQQTVPQLQLLAAYKYDHYQRFQPGKRFIESLALWLRRIDASERPAALEFVQNRLIFFSDTEFSHLVDAAYPDVIVHERLRLVAEEYGISAFQVAKIARHKRFEELRLKSLYLGLSDGARTSELRRASAGEITNEQISHAYELGQDKVNDMIAELRSSLSSAGLAANDQRFNLVWLLDDFSGSGHTYIRYDHKERRFKGKLKKAYDILQQGLVNVAHCEVFLLLYVATQQAVEHIEYWGERFTSENGNKHFQIRVMCPLERGLAISDDTECAITEVVKNCNYYDHNVHDRHFKVGGTKDARLGFAACGLPVVLAHNTPNNSLYILWGSEFSKFPGLFPRVSRHQEV